MVPGYDPDPVVICISDTGSRAFRWGEPVYRYFDENPELWRFLKIRGQDAIYVCADDTHGTPIMIKAMQEDIKPEKLIDGFHAEHARDFSDFHIEFDIYGSTHCDENRKWSDRSVRSSRMSGFDAPASSDTLSAS